MLNYCIQKKKLHYEQSSKPVSLSNSSASLKAKPPSQPSECQSGLISDTPKQSAWELEVDESDSDDEFFEAVEEQDKVSRNSKSEEMEPLSPNISSADIQSQNGSPSGSFLSLSKSGSEISFGRTGALKETEMLLLETKEPLCIPVTQVCNAIYHIRRICKAMHVRVLSLEIPETVWR